MDFEKYFKEPKTLNQLLQVVAENSRYDELELLNLPMKDLGELIEITLAKQVIRAMENAFLNGKKSSDNQDRPAS